MLEPSRPTGDQLLAKLQADQTARLRIYIGAAPGVGKTYSMIEDAHAFRHQGMDVVIGFVETHGRAETEARIRNLEVIPRRRVDYRGVVLEEMDVDAIIARQRRTKVRRRCFGHRSRHHRAGRRWSGRKPPKQSMRPKRRSFAARLFEPKDCAARGCQPAR